MSDASSSDAEERRYDYLIDTALYRIGETNNPDELHNAQEHVKRASAFGMHPKDILARLISDTWYEDLDDDGESLSPFGKPRKEDKPVNRLPLG